MKPAIAIGAIALAGAVVYGCGREERIPEAAAKVAEKTVDVTRDLARQAEKEAERGVAMLDDARVTATLKTALIAEPGLKGMSIDVDTSANVVTLNGTVATDSARKRAGELARATEGVKDVHNNLTVERASLAARRQTAK